MFGCLLFELIVLVSMVCLFVLVLWVGRWWLLYGGWLRVGVSFVVIIAWMLVVWLVWGLRFGGVVL